MAYYINNLNQKIAYKHIKGKSPGIVFIHGLNSDMQGEKSISLEKYAKKNKISFTKFDCRGHGKSFGKFEDFTITNWLKDLIDIIDNVTKGPQILVGSSMGGWLMMLASKKRKKRIHGLIGIAAAPDFGDDLYASLSRKSKLEIQKKGSTKYVFNKNWSYILTKKFFKDAKKNEILKNKFIFSKPIILIHGIKDDVIHYKIPFKIMNKTTCSNLEIHYVKSGDHSLSSESNIKLILSNIDRLRKK